MRTQNDDSNAQQPLPAKPANHSLSDWERPPLGGGEIVGTADEVTRFEEVKRCAIEASSNGSSQAEKLARTVVRKERKQAQAKNQELTAAQSKPARVKRSKPQPVNDPKDQAEVVSKPRRTSTRKAGKVVDALAEPVSTVIDMPPITPKAIEYLGNQDATAADVLKLGPESLAFVQYHFKHMQQIEAQSELTGAYLLANAEPISPAFLKFFRALVKQSQRQRAPVTVQAGTEVLEPYKQRMATVPTVSYNQKATAVGAWTPVVVQLRKVEINFSKKEAQEQAQASEAVLDDTDDARRVVGTARILTSAPINERMQNGEGDVVASDIHNVSAIKDAAARNFEPDVIAESSQTRPQYKVEVAKLAPGVVVQAAQAHKAMKVDWSRSYEVGSTLSYITEASRPLDKETIPTLANSTNEARAPGAPTQASYKEEQAKTERAGRDAQELENSIEKSPVQVVAAVQQRSSARQEAPAEQEATADPGYAAGRRSAEQQSATSAPPAKKPTFDPVAHPSLSRWLLLGIGGAVQKAGAWLSEQGMKDKAAAPAAPVSLEKRTASVLPAEPTAQADDISTVVPEAVARRFLKVGHEYYFYDRTPAFSDRGTKLATRGANPEVVRSLVEVAKARRWETITVKGTEEFRRSAWMEAAQNGLSVVGYKPTSLDLAELATCPASNTVEKIATKDENAVSTQPATKVGSSPSSDRKPANLKTSGQETQQANPALAEKAKAFQGNKPALVVKKYPDLASAYGLVAAATAFAADKLPQAARQEFVDMARSHVIQKIMAAVPILGPKIYVAPTRTAEVGGQVKAKRETAELERQSVQKAS